MRGLYEQQWQEAMSGAAIEPSADLWDKIATDLDSDRGRHNWVTILLIAATVTVAFAFPLTVGNSSLEVRESYQPKIAQIDNSNTHDQATNNIAAETISESTSKENLEQGIQKSSLAEDTNISHTENFITQVEENEAAVGSANEPAENKALTSTESISITGSSATGYGMVAFNLDNTLSVVDINDYYFIPFFMPLDKKVNRSMLASLNMGTGSLSEGSGFNTFSAMEAADAPFDLSGNVSTSDAREEEAGSTYYFGAGVELPFGNRWSLLAGLGYLAQNANGTSNVILDVGSSAQPLGAYDPIVPGTIFLSETYNYSVTNGYINVPITVKYPFVNRKIKFRAGAGISTDFMISHIVNSEQYGKANYNPTSMGYKTVVLSGLINLDISYSLNNKYSVALETGLRKGFTAIDEGKDFYPSSFTVGLILFYKLK